MGLSDRLNELGIYWFCGDQSTSVPVRFSTSRCKHFCSQRIKKLSTMPASCREDLLAHSPTSSASFSKTQEHRRCTVPPLLGLRELTVALDNTKRYNDSERRGGRVILMPNITRWSSWMTMIESALTLKSNRICGISSPGSTRGMFLKTPINCSSLSKRSKRHAKVSMSGLIKCLCPSLLSSPTSRPRSHAT